MAQVIKISSRRILSAVFSSVAPIQISPCYLNCGKIWKRNLRTSTAKHSREGSPAEIAAQKKGKAAEMKIFNEMAETMQKKDKETFLKAVQIYESRQSVYKRGHVDFLLASLDKVQEFSVHKDLATYKKLMEVFPAEVMIPKNLIQYEAMHYPKQQDTAMRILAKMESFAVTPDDEMADIIEARFGLYSYVMKRYQRMMYWMPKFKHMNPHPIPWMLPTTGEELALIALRRMARDKNNEIKLQYSTELEDSAHIDTFIATATSQTQRELMAKHDPAKPLYVEGGFRVWLRDKSLTYFILRADPTQEILEYNNKLDAQEEKDVSSGFFSFIGADDDKKSEAHLIPQLSVHEQEEGIIMAMCITGTSDKDSLVCWINLLQEENPCLSRIPIVFSLRSMDRSLQPSDQTTLPSHTREGGTSPTLPSHTQQNYYYDSDNLSSASETEQSDHEPR